MSLRRPLSLNSRVMLFVAAAVSLSLLISGYLVMSAVKQHFAEQDAEELKVITRTVEVALNTSIVKNQRVDLILPQAISGHHGVYFQVWDESQQLIYATPDFDLSVDTIAYVPLRTIEAENLYIWPENGKTYRGVVVNTELGQHQYNIIAAIDMGFHIHFMESFTRTLWLIMILAEGLTLLAAWYGVHKGHAPVRRLSESMRDIQADSLHVRLDRETVPAELKPLVDSFNHMLSRLQDSFVRLSHFSADIAHELRTPLTNLITQTQVGLGKTRKLEEYRELLYSNLEEQERLTKMVNDMLWLAQTENGLLKPKLERIVLMDEVRTTSEFFEALAEEKHVHMLIEGDAATVVGDRSMLRRVLSNLLSNALRFTTIDGQIRITVKECENAVHLYVENSGPEIPAEHLPRLFDRFYRVDPSRQRQTEGTGLGLAIVKSIVEAHEGSIDVTSSHGKTRFIIMLPTSSNEM